MNESTSVANPTYSRQMSSRARIKHLGFLILPVLVMALPLACEDKRSSGPSSLSSGATNTPASTVIPRTPRKTPERTGGALMRSADGQRLYLADEDHNVVRVLPLPFGDEPKPPPPVASASASAAAVPPAPSASASASGSASARPPPPPPPDGSRPPIPPPPNAKQNEFVVPGPPAQVLPLDGMVLVTIRNPGLLLVLREKADHGLEEAARISIALDAWGMAISPDDKTVIVTSAWTHTVTGIDLASNKVLWTMDTAREPRGVVIHPDGKRAYISHLTSGDLTRIDDIAQPSAKLSTVPFPAAPQRAPQGVTSGATLGYALVIDDSGHRLLAARHALAALGPRSWFGSPTVDVLQMENDKPLMGPRVRNSLLKTTPAFDETKQWATSTFAALDSSDYRLRQFAPPELADIQHAQPRALLLAHKSETLWLASEANDSVVEMNLRAGAPLESVKREVQVGSRYDDPRIFVSYGGGGIAGHCGAPSGLALNEEETMLYVFCRSTYDVATVLLTDPKNAPVLVARVAADPLGEAGSRGRRLFYGGKDSYSSDGLGCAGCHPEGRDDGVVWHDVVDLKEQWRNGPVFMASQYLAEKTNGGRRGYPRQTPMLVGRVNASGPYGWHAQSENMTLRLAEGFGRHRWSGSVEDGKSWMLGERANALVVFLRKGLVPPPRLERPLTEQEAQGKKVFESEATQCARCHVPASDLTDRVAYPFDKLPPPAGFEDEEDNKFKTPSLLFVSGSPPYYHDGHAATLDSVVMGNNDRMGKTNHLSGADKAALVAYLKTL